MIKRFSVILLSVFFICMMTACSSLKITKKRSGNTEVVTAKEGSKIIYQLVYTYKGGRIVKGEHWVAFKKEKKKKKEKKNNIFSGTAIEKKFNALLQGKNFKDLSGVTLGTKKNGLRLNFVQLVVYDSSGRPKKVMRRGYTNIPIVGRFHIKTDLSYKYNRKGQLMKIVEQNMNVDTLLLKFAIGNYTQIDRDGRGRPTKVTKVFGTVPPSYETTKYTYYGATNNMRRTVYDKVDIDLKTVSTKVTEQINVWYRPGVPWKGKKKYKFDMDKTIKGLRVWDNINKKNKLDGSGFTKMNYLQKAKFLKSIYDLIKLEMQGPTWRMGDLPDVPEPFLIYGDYAWYN